MAWESLSVKDYDFLIDEGVNPDDVFLTQEQQQAIRETKRAPRPTGLEYKKTYPEARREIYNTVVQTVIEKGGENVLTTKGLRDIDFMFRGKQFKLVLSEPRNPKKL